MRNSTIRVATFAGPGAEPVIRAVPWPQVGKKAALIQIGACGVCGTDLHILKGNWPKPLPWPFTLGHELGGVIVETGGEFTQDFMGSAAWRRSKVMIPPLMPWTLLHCVHYPQANKCLTSAQWRYPGFAWPHLWGGFPEYVYVDLDMLPGTVYKLPDDAAGLGALGAAHLLHPRVQPRDPRRRIHLGRHGGSRAPGRSAFSPCRRARNGRRSRDRVGAPETPRLELARKFGAGDGRDQAVADPQHASRVRTSSAALAPTW
jgi:hypothetical protein